MRKELILCDHCGGEIAVDSGGALTGFQLNGSVTMTGSEPSTTGLSSALNGTEQVLGAGEYCSRKCLSSAISKAVDETTETLNQALYAR